MVSTFYLFSTDVTSLGELVATTTASALTTLQLLVSTGAGKPPIIFSTCTSV
ncbi:MAG: hypothetical protein V7K40_04245 [Nostoc sp.]